MFDINECYKTAKMGEIQDSEEIINYIKSFSYIYIWGAGNLGTVIGHYLMTCGVNITGYWDMRSDTINSCNGLHVVQPFDQLTSKENVLVLLCITNAFVIPELIHQLKTRKIDFLRGDYIYQAMICPVSEDNFDVSLCNNREECNVATCERLGNIIYKVNQKQEKVFIQTIDIYVTQRCSLECKYCYIYTNSYPKEKRIHYPTQQILDDIDVVCDAASYIKRMVAFGGEPFLHPDIDIIIEKMASKKNVGIIDIISNGIFKQPRKKLESLNYPNVRIDVSNYNMSLKPELIKIREDNCRLLKELGLNVTIHNETPQWGKPGTLFELEESDEQLLRKKKNCGNFFKQSQKEVKTDQTFIAKNGKFYPCQHCDTIHNLGIKDYKTDYMLLSKNTSIEQTIKEMKLLISKEWYGACKHCKPSGELVEKAGEQGYDNIYSVS